MENLKQTIIGEKAKKLAIEQTKKGAMLNWAEYQIFKIYKEQFEKNYNEYQHTKNDKKISKILDKMKYYNHGLNKLRVKAIKESVLSEDEKNLFYKMIEVGYLTKVNKLDAIILKMYDLKNQRSIFEEAKNA